jgi:S-adenosylmethionine hydrolase
MKAAVLSACPTARLIDVSHGIEPFDVRGGGFVLWAGTRAFPSGSVHLAVVDPGVGSERRALALQVGRSYYVGPDNGLFWMVVRGRTDVGAVVLRRPEDASPTFEGRDVFAPAAGRLAAGDRIYALGPPAGPLRPLDDLDAAVVWVDRFGNLVTNLEPPVARLRVNGHLIAATAKTYAKARAGKPFWYVGSLGLVEIGFPKARADEKLGAQAGSPVEVLPAS